MTTELKRANENRTQARYVTTELKRALCDGDLIVENTNPKKEMSIRSRRWVRMRRKVGDGRVREMYGLKDGLAPGGYSCKLPESVSSAPRQRLDGPEPHLVSPRRHVHGGLGIYPPAAVHSLD